MLTQRRCSGPIGDRRRIANGMKFAGTEGAGGIICQFRFDADYLAFGVCTLGDDGGPTKQTAAAAWNQQHIQ